MKEHYFYQGNGNDLKQHYVVICILCDLAPPPSQCNTTFMITDPRFLSHFVRCNVPSAANDSQNSKDDILTLPVI